jgi:hypothetical protein
MARYLVEPPTLQERLLASHDFPRAHLTADERRRIEALGAQLRVFGPSEPIYDEIMRQLEAIEREAERRRQGTNGRA